MEHDLLCALLARLSDLALIPEEVCRAAQAAVSESGPPPALLEGLSAAGEVSRYGFARHSG